MAEQWVYSFGGGLTEGRADMRELLGGKGANLAEMSSIDLPVPPGFTITTEVCTHYYDHEKNYPDALSAQVEKAIKRLEQEMGMGFGDAANPLLVSVRSGARVSMPGMMDTVLNLGLNDETVQGLVKKSGDERFAWDSYRRFIQMYGDVVLGVPHHDFEDILDSHKRDEGITQDTDVTAAGWKAVVAEYKELVERELGKPFPVDPQEQLWGAISAVFNSWMVPRAITYRQIHEIPESWGTAVNVQCMVFGNMGQDCATGVAFTRDPSTGENYFYGEYLVNAQGEDVVAGIRTPQSLTIKGKEKEGSDLPAMEEVMPEVFGQLNDVRLKLEQHYREMQDIEFTVQQGKLFMLQTRTGKRTTAAALKIAVDLVSEGVITQEEALLRVDAQALDQLLHPTLDPMAHKHIVAKGLPASPGAACGMVMFSADDAEAKAAEGESVILVRRETSPEDIHGMHAAAGILTSRGGMTSHAAVVARGMGRPCVAGAGSIQIDYETKSMIIDGEEIKEGDIITIDGAAGEVMMGKVPTIQPQLSGDFATVMDWADAHRRMVVRTNAETPLDAETARDFGAQGIGLCRTEHMFFDPDRIQNVREMIFASDTQGREKALAKLLPEQRQDFASLFHIMQGLPVTIRLLDPPLHEFLPQGDEDIQSFAKTAQLDEDTVRRRLGELHETNPMLGHRGCRLGVTYPEIYAMQVRAIIEAALEVQDKDGSTASPEIMIPLVATVKELAMMKALAERTAEDVFAAKGKRTEYMIGTMIELPRAALTADEIAGEAAFFSFGTNDLTQTTLGLSRDDAASFMADYLREGIFERDPFASLDQDGVGQLVQMAADKGRSVRPDIKLGICGEHGGDPASIAFCERVGLDYVSCSPYRVPIARLAAAQASIRAGSAGRLGKPQTQIKRKAA
ncbi:MAG: pyruvate, phosphate dikinase [Rhodospirillales bacterium]|nr:pyruvate, phosphate dikinase [Rhodospirillales bacterium]MCB9995215.1 pyruvate, phosphate dikinase [Rhodospirillales bacterium]